jgi:hypothetical protein
MKQITYYVDWIIYNMKLVNSAIDKIPKFAYFQIINSLSEQILVSNVSGLVSFGWFPLAI